MDEFGIGMIVAIVVMTVFVGVMFIVSIDFDFDDPWNRGYARDYCISKGFEGMSGDWEVRGAKLYYECYNLIDGEFVERWVLVEGSK